MVHGEHDAALHRDALGAVGAERRQEPHEAPDRGTTDGPGDVDAVHAGRRERTSASIRSTTSSTSRSLVSITSASSAGCMRARSLSSRARRSVASASAPMSGRSAWRRCSRTRPVGDEVDLDVGVRADDRADVAALDHRVALLRELALALPHDLAHLGMPRDDRHHAVDPRLADRGGDVGARDRHAPRLVELDAVLAREGAELVAAAERSMPSCIASHVRARYIAPVSR